MSGRVELMLLLDKTALESQQTLLNLETRSLGEGFGETYVECF